MKYKLCAIGFCMLSLSLSTCIQDPGPGNQIHQELKEGAPESVGISSERLDRIDLVVKQYVDNQWISGATGIIASMSKDITTVAVMMLYEEGYFLLDDPLYKFIPEFKDPVILDEVNLSDSTFTAHPAKNQITIRQLLNHTSGIGYSFSHERLRPLYQKAGIPDGLNVTDGEGGLRPSTDKDYYYPVKGGKSYYSGGGGFLSTAEDMVAVSMTQMFPAPHGEIHRKFQVGAYQSISD